jgi:hypothetical protein
VTRLYSLFKPPAAPPEGALFFFFFKLPQACVMKDHNLIKTKAFYKH